MTSEDEDAKFIRVLRFIALALYVGFIIVSLAVDAAEKKFSTD